MTRKGRLWVGITLLAIIAANYILIGFPLISKSNSIKEKAKAILVKQVKSDRIFKNSDEEYMLELFRKEKASIDTKILILNCAAATVAFIAASWTVFGLFKKQ